MDQTKKYIYIFYLFNIYFKYLTFSWMVGGFARNANGKPFKHIEGIKLNSQRVDPSHTKLTHI